MQSKKKGRNIFLNKKGQGLPTNAIILIILGVVVLALLVIGFIYGWNTLLPWLKSDNVETIVQQCNAACVTGGKYDFCSKARELNDGEIKVKTNCATFAIISEYNKYGIAECPAIECDFECTDIKVGKEDEQREGKVFEEVDLIEGKCPEDYDDITSIVKVIGGQKCCVPKVFSENV